MAWMYSFFFALFLAYTNGANDNFKGVASLFGSGTTTFRRALIWATFTTALGALTALLLARGLIASFSGKGLVPDTLVTQHSFSLSVALAAALTVALATWRGFPVSTTHALVGALVGVGLAGSSSGVNFSKLQSSFLIPLLLSPLLSIGATVCLYPLIRLLERTPQAPSTIKAPDTIQALASTGSARKLTATDILHFLSAGVVSFARGLNDTPKLTALLLAGTALSLPPAILWITTAMSLGGLLNARKVAETMSNKITALTPVQGLTANLVTGLLVILASKSGLPVSTTHVSCGSLFGIGIVNRSAQWKTIASILLAWITTLPIAALLGAICFLVIHRLAP